MCEPEHAVHLCGPCQIEVDAETEKTSPNPPMHTENMSKMRQSEQANSIRIKEIRTNSLSAVMEPVGLMEPSNLGSVGLEGTGIAVSSLANGCLSSAFAFPIIILPLAKGLTSLWLEPGSPFARDKYTSAEQM